MILRESIDEVIETAQVADVISDYVKLKRSGRNMKGLCPFHNEKTPSFVVSPDKNIYKCFGCGKAGNSISFLMELEGLNFPEAIRSLAAKYGITLKEDNREDTQEYEERDALYLINEAAQKFYSENLWTTDFGKSVGVSYFKERGFIKKTLEKYNIGICRQEPNALLKHLLDAGFEKEKIEASGLLNQYGKDFFRDRVIFPIQNASGKTLGFAGRILKTREKAPKYINTRETEIYNKRKVLYGLFQSRQEIRRLDNCILVEGYTDVMSLHQFDIKNVVAASGTSLTEEQCQLIKRYTENLTLIFDGDNAGLKAAFRGMDVVLQQGLFPQIVMLPEGEDPDSAVRSMGSEDFKAYIQENQKDFILFKSEILLDETQNKPIQKVRAYQDIAATVAKIPDPMSRSVYIKECSGMFDIEEEIILNEVNKVLKDDLKLQRLKAKRSQQRPPKTSIEGNKIVAKTTGDTPLERDLVRTLLLYADKELKSGQTLGEFIMDNFASELDQFDDEESAEILKTMFEGFRQKEYRKLDYFVAQSNKKISQLCIDLVSTPHSYSDNWEDMMENTMLNQPPPDQNYEVESYEQTLRIKMRKINKLIEQTKEALTTLDKDDDEVDVKLNVLRRLQIYRNEIAQNLRQIAII